MKKANVVAELLKDRPLTPGARGEAYAPANIALCKYWGKRDEEINLPVTSSLSMSLGTLGAHTLITPCDTADRVYLDEQEVDPASSFAQRISRYLDLVRTNDFYYEVRTTSTVPVAAGLASSASGFAALAKALDQLYGWNLDAQRLSILARLGSGSAARSVYDGFVEWHAGARPDGMDSYAEPLDVKWPELRIGLLELSTREKPVGSREAMKRTHDNGVLYEAWPEKVADDLIEIRAALHDHDFERLGRAAESNALSMHATMLSAWPPILYWLPETVAALHTVWETRRKGIPVYATMDAGPNVKLLFENHHRALIQEVFTNLRIV